MSMQKWLSKNKIVIQKCIKFNLLYYPVAFLLIYPKQSQAIYLYLLVVAIVISLCFSFFIFRNYARQSRSQ